MSHDNGEKILGVSTTDVHNYARANSPVNIIDHLNPFTIMSNAIKSIFASIIVIIMLIIFLVILFKKNEHACTMSKKIAGAC